MRVRVLVRVRVITIVNDVVSGIATPFSYYMMLHFQIIGTILLLINHSFSCVKLLTNVVATLGSSNSIVQL